MQEGLNGGPGYGDVVHMHCVTWVHHSTVAWRCKELVQSRVGYDNLVPVLWIRNMMALARWTQVAVPRDLHSKVLSQSETGEVAVVDVDLLLWVHLGEGADVTAATLTSCLIVCLLVDRLGLSIAATSTIRSGHAVELVVGSLAVRMIWSGHAGSNWSAVRVGD